jgi:hypothetical protein
MTCFIVLTEGLGVFIRRTVAVDGRRLPSGNVSFAKRTSVGWMSGGGVESRMVRLALAEELWGKSL